MGNALASTRQFKESHSSDSCTVGGSSDSEYVTAPATESPEPGAATSSSTLFSAHSSVEELIERSKRHWSEVAHLDSDIDEDDEEAVMADNVQVFRSLQMHLQWGNFFRTFGDSEDDIGELVMGEKFAEGGQAELYYAHIKWQYTGINEKTLEERIKWVVKVFKKGTLLRCLQLQWPKGFLQFKATQIEDSKPGRIYTSPTRFTCDVVYGILLKDGRFAFLMVGEFEDLRRLIDHHLLMTSPSAKPFSKTDEEFIMYHIALGMEWLHSYNIVHRDLKASNVLMAIIGKRKLVGDIPDFGCSMEIAKKLYPVVADYECSMGVIGTGFFRAPEILQACKDGNASQKQQLYSKQADVYSFGMTCYEILTRKLPFEGHSLRNYDLILEGQQPDVPEDVDDWVRELLSRCWQLNSEARPTFKEILNVFEANSEVAQSTKVWIQDRIAEWNMSQDRDFTRATSICGT